MAVWQYGTKSRPQLSQLEADIDMQAAKTI